MVERHIRPAGTFRFIERPDTAGLSDAPPALERIDEHQFRFADFATERYWPKPGGPARQLTREGASTGGDRIATVYAPEIENSIVDLLVRAANEDIDEPSARLLFRGVHILGGRRLSGGFRALIALLHAPQARIDYVLGDAVTETLPKILAGMFDGDPEPLLALIADLTVDEFVRNAALGAFTTLVFDRKIERTFAEDYLRHFERECEAPHGDMIWHAWMTAVALLGFEQLSNQVHTAFADGRIPLDVADEENYREILDAALARPNDPQRLTDDHLGYIEDVLAELERWPPYEPDAEADDDDFRWSPPDQRRPVRNPWAGVGRNDPCPCGSGKKFKKCCLR